MTDVPTLLAGIKERATAAMDYPGHVTVEESATDVPRLIQALEAVAEAHDPVDALMNPGRHERVVKVCAGCGTDDGNWQRWPCPTITAVVAALGGEE